MVGIKTNILFLVVLALLIAFFGTTVKGQSIEAEEKLPVIFTVQTGGSGSGTATQELIEIYNISDSDIKISNWCVEYRSSGYNLGFKSCVDPEPGIDVWLSAKSYANFVSDSFIDANDDFMRDFELRGGMSSTSGHVVLINELGDVVDLVGWGAATQPETEAATAHSSGHVLSRDFTRVEIDTDNNLYDFVGQFPKVEYISGIFESEIDYCTNFEGVQSLVPDGFAVDENFECFELGSSILVINELLPNPESYDSGNEFIELYNPNDTSIELIDYKLAVGPDYTKEFVFEGASIESGKYLILTDDETGITLTNSEGKVLRLIAPNGSVVSESEVYFNSAENESWSRFDAGWAYSNRPTPGSENKPMLIEAVDESVAGAVEYAPCPEGKFRNPETNRCKSYTTSTLKPCEPHQYRHPDTNRCRNIESSSALAPCPEGKYRNSDTNRCINVAVLGANEIAELPVVQDVQIRHTKGSITWSTIIAASAATIGYIIYEWRNEIRLKVIALKRIYGYNGS